MTETLSDNKPYLTDLPPIWERAKLGDILTLEYGKGLPRAKRNPNGKVPVYGSSGIAGYHDQPLNDRPCLIIGRKGAAGSVHLSEVPCWTIDTAYYVEPPNGIDLAYLFYLLRTAGLSDLDKSTAVPSLSRDDAHAVSVPVAPSNEQRRIVEKIEELFTKLDAGIQSVKQAQVLLKSYRRSVLKAAVEGDLSRKWREAHQDESEPASELLERILQEGREKSAGTKNKARVAAEASNLSALPEGWTLISLDQALAEKMVNGLSVKGSDSPPGIAALKLDAMTTNGFNFTRVRYLPIERARAENLWVKEGDFFISRGNGTLSLVGRGTVPQEPPFPTIFPDTMIRARIVSTLRSSAWIPTIWQSPHIRRQIEAKAKTTAGIYKVSQADLKSIALPLPPLEEQRFIVGEVERRLSVVDKLEATVEGNLKQAEILGQSILGRAFSGKLVPQDPNDEPASALLERIKAEQDRARSAVRRGKRSKGRAVKSKQDALFPDSLYRVLLTAEEKLTPETLFQMSRHSADTIDQFYAELKEEIEKERIRESRDQHTILLEAVPNEA